MPGLCRWARSVHGYLGVSPVPGRLPPHSGLAERTDRPRHSVLRRRGGSGSDRRTGSTGPSLRGRVAAQRLGQGRQVRSRRF
ncbi:hypothetical protein [Ornithinimicrobium kibberense]|uniref:hypothetical protein n=1 Tax=Ornithinimicrobium kibberense TaxID=282060 RepID=UPI0036201A39